MTVHGRELAYQSSSIVRARDTERSHLEGLAEGKLCSERGFLGIYTGGNEEPKLNGEVRQEQQNKQLTTTMPCNYTQVHNDLSAYFSSTPSLLSSFRAQLAHETGEGKSVTRQLEFPRHRKAKEARTTLHSPVAPR